MRIMMSMKWDGLSLDQYEEIRQLANWEGDLPNGAVFHVAGEFDNALRVTDIWESADFNHFVQNRLMPAVAKVGIESQPPVDVFPVYAVFSPVTLVTV